MAAQKYSREPGHVLEPAWSPGNAAESVGKSYGSGRNPKPGFPRDLAGGGYLVRPPNTDLRSAIR